MGTQRQSPSYSRNYSRTIGSGLTHMQFSVHACSGRFKEAKVSKFRIVMVNPHTVNPSFFNKAASPLQLNAIILLPAVMVELEEFSYQTWSTMT